MVHNLRELPWSNDAAAGPLQLLGRRCRRYILELVWSLHVLADFCTEYQRIAIRRCLRWQLK